MVKQSFFIAETKGSLDRFERHPVEQDKISFAKKLFDEISSTEVKCHDVDFYLSLITERSWDK